MKRSLFSVLAILLCALTASAQTGAVKLRLHVVLIDRELNQKPVPNFVVTLQRTGTAAKESIELKTGLNGMAEKPVPAGRYTVATPHPIEFQGKRYSWTVEVTVSGAEQTLELTNDNAKTEDVAGEAGRSGSSSSGGGDLTALFDKLKNSIVKVRAEAHDGSGFVVDPAGLIVTNNHVVQSSSYLAVQFDHKRKVAARLIATNADKDVAVLWVNLAPFPEAVVAPLVADGSSSPIAVGERVFTIGNPLGREKVLTTGVISKVEKDSITSDININPGNSGGPLFTMDGKVAGITTAGLRRLASIVPIQEARALVEQSRRALAGSGAPPSAELLPVEPADFFPADVLRALLQREKMDTKPYFFDAGEFQVAFITPTVNYFLRHEDEMAAARKAAKRASGDSSQAKPPASALEDAQDYRPVLIVRVRPKFGFWKVRFKNGFQRMRLLCGGKELGVIDPGRSEFELRDPRGRTIDTTFQGFYTYPPDAVSPACGGVILEIFSEKDANTPISKPIDPYTIERVWADLEPYRRAHTSK